MCDRVPTVTSEMVIAAREAFVAATRLGWISESDIRVALEAAVRCDYCGHAVSSHYGRWCRAETGAVNRDGRHLICCREAADATSDQSNGDQR